MKIEDIKNKLSALDLPQSEINEITSTDEAKTIARKLLTAAS